MTVVWIPCMVGGGYGLSVTTWWTGRERVWFDISAGWYLDVRIKDYNKALNLMCSLSLYFFATYRTIQVETGSRREQVCRAQLKQRKEKHVVTKTCPPVKFSKIRITCCRLYCIWKCICTIIQILTFKIINLLPSCPDSAASSCFLVSDSVSVEKKQH